MACGREGTRCGEQPARSVTKGHVHLPVAVSHEPPSKGHRVVPTAQHGSLSWPQALHALPEQTVLAAVQPLKPAQHGSPNRPQAWQEPPEQTVLAAVQSAPSRTHSLELGSQQPVPVHFGLVRQHDPPTLPHAHEPLLHR